MKSIIFIIPYFGKLSNYFKLWLNSCRYNSTIDFLLFTDDKTNFDYPSNVKVVYTTFEDVKAKIQSKFDFEIVLQKPYKLCDYRPAYGEVFSDHIKNYDFWGHCDLDLIWGDIRKFLTEDILSKYKRILTHGHCTLYLNTNEVNAYYRTLPNYDYNNYKDVFTTNESKYFDESNIYVGGGTVDIFRKNNIEMYEANIIFDLNFCIGYFEYFDRNDNEKKQYILFEKGKVYSVSNDHRTEGLYVHFQKRDLIIDNELDYSKIFLLPPYYVTSVNKKIKFQSLRCEKFKFDSKIKNKIKKIKMKLH